MSTKRRNPLHERNPCMARSRFRNGTCAFSARLFKTLCCPMLQARHDLALSGAIRGKLIGDHAPGTATLLAQKPVQQPLGRPCVAANLDDFVQHIAVLVGGAPKEALFAVDGNHDFIEMPDVVPGRLFPLQTPCVVRTEFDRPTTHGLVGEHDPPFEEHFLDKAKAEGKPEIEPDSVGDDLRRETVALIAHGQLGHTCLVGAKPLSSR